MPTLQTVIDILERQGAEQYGSEPVSQLAHALQSAALAEQAGSRPELIAAALLHDIGHLVDNKFQVGQDNPVDRHHENIGSAYLKLAMPPAVTEPIRLHVPAKRYLCWADAAYFGGLSQASVRSLELQGGVFDEAEARTFIEQPYAEDAVALRRWDDLAKVPDAETPPLAHFIPYVEQSMKAAQTV